MKVGVGKTAGNVSVFTGKGGNGLGTGAGGAMTAVNVTGGSVGAVSVTTGPGGTAMGTGKGASGGAMSSVVLTIGDASSITVAGGSGGASSTGSGGAGGGVTGFTLTGGGNVDGDLFAGTGGSAADLGSGGKGGSISALKASIGGVASFNVFAGPGGTGTAANAKGGHGASIVKNTLNVGSHVALVMAGNVGTPGTGGPAASGGSITGLTVLGSGLIGAPGTGYVAAQSLHVGLSTDPAKNGGVSKIVATAISSIVAGAPAANAITAANAVSVIAGLAVKRLGADLNGDFIVTDGAGTWAGPGDAGSLLDGIVLVKNTPANVATLTGKIIAPNFLFTVA